MSDRHGTYAARLGCGTLLVYEVASWVPGVGENVPCPRHGYCRVTARERAGGGRSGRSGGPPRRTIDELVDFLCPRPVTTVAILRRNRFTLRVVAAAHREG